MTAASLRAPLAVMLAAAGVPAAGQPVPVHPVDVREIHRDGAVAIVGSLGLPVGRMVRLEGRRARPSKVTDEATLEVAKVDGREPSVPESRRPVHVHLHNVDSLPADEPVVLEGFEFVRWMGEPGTNWHLAAELQVTSVVSPAGLRLNGRGPGVAPSRALEITTGAPARWMLRFELSGAAHAQYGSLPGDGGFVPPGSVDFSRLARDLASAAGGAAAAGPDRIQVSAWALCAADAVGCDPPEGSTAPLSDAQQRVVLRLLADLETRWRPDEYGTKRFDELRQRFPIAPR